MGQGLNSETEVEVVQGIDHGIKTNMVLCVIGSHDRINNKTEGYE
jgi:hypothetical protein